MTIKPPQRYGTRIILISFMVLVAMVLFASTAIGAPDYVAGDVNDDGLIDVRDVVLVQKHILGLQFPPLTQLQLLAADVNGDGDINISDAVIIMQIALGIIDSYPMPIISLNDAVVRVPIGTALADINIPTTVEANFAGGLKRNIGVRWEQVSTPAYNPFVFDEYHFKGTLVNLPSGVRNPAGLTAIARVSFLLRDPWPFPGPEPDAPYRLQLQPNPAQGGMAYGSGIYRAGAQIQVNAVPNADYSFINWTRNGQVVSTNPTFIYIMPALDTTLVANFTPGSLYTLTLIRNPVAGGNVTGGGVFPAGAVAQVSAAPNPGYSFVNWTRNGLVVSTNATFNYITTANNSTLTANFTIWPIEMEGPPVIVETLFGYEVTVTIRENYKNQVSALTILGEPAVQLPAPNNNRWRFTFPNQVTLNELVNKIIIELTPSVLDMTQTRSVRFFVGDTVVQVYLKPGITALSVVADGNALTYNGTYWQSGELLGYNVGDLITVTVITADVTQAVVLTVEEAS